MGRICTRALLILLTLVVCPLLASGGSSRTIPSTDRLPRGDWTYDAMIGLAAHGLVEGYPARVFEGDRLFTRMEMARLVGNVVRDTAGEELGLSTVALIGRLVSEFRPELEAVDPDVAEEWASRSLCAPAGETFPLGYVRGRAVGDTGEDGSSLIVPYRQSVFSSLSDRTFVIGTLADREEKFAGELRDGPWLDKVLVKGFDRNFVWAVGRDYLSWGPSYSGSVIMSDNSDGFVQARGIKEFDFGKLFGRVKITQFVSTFEDGGEDLYLFGRRYEKRLSDRWHLGISETAKTSETPNPLILVLPFYLYQHLFSEVDEEFNSMYAADLLYETKRGWQFYGELLIDDITAPRIFGERFERPRKTAYTLGLYVPKVLRGGTSTFRAEYIFVDRLTYGATREGFPELAYTHNDEVIGHPIGPNAKAVYLRGEQYFSRRFSAIVEFLNQRQTDPGAPERGERKLMSAQFAYDIAPDKSVALRVVPYEITPAGGARRSGTQYEALASFGF